MKNKLTELLHNLPENNVIVGGVICGKKLHTAETIAEHLINNNVIVLPCKVGDRLYLTRCGKIREETIEKIELSDNSMCFFFNWGGGGYEFISLRDLGKTAFLTREDALAALKNSALSEKTKDGKN